MNVLASRGRSHPLVGSAWPKNHPQDSAFEGKLQSMDNGKRFCRPLRGLWSFWGRLPRAEARGYYLSPASRALDLLGDRDPRAEARGYYLSPASRAFGSFGGRLPRAEARGYYLSSANAGFGSFWGRLPRAEARGYCLSPASRAIDL